MKKIIDLIGKEFGKLTVIGFAFIKDYRKYLQCKCSCGNIKNVREDSLKNGTTIYKDVIILIFLTIRIMVEELHQSRFVIDGMLKEVDHLKIFLKIWVNPQQRNIL